MLRAARSLIGAAARPLMGPQARMRATTMAGGRTAGRSSGAHLPSAASRPAPTGAASGHLPNRPSGGGFRFPAGDARGRGGRYMPRGREGHVPSRGARAATATSTQVAAGGRMGKWGKRAAVAGGAALGAGFATRTGSGSDTGNRSLYGPPGGMM